MALDKISGWIGKSPAGQVVSGYGTRPAGYTALAGVEVSLFTTGTRTRVKAPTISDAGGRWSFEDVASGTYDIGFSGMGALSPAQSSSRHCWLLEYLVPEDVAGGVEAIVFVGTPTLSVTEASSGEFKPDANINKDEYTYALISLADMATTQGTVASVRLEFKIATDASYKLLQEFKIGGVSTFSLYIPLVLKYKPVDIDFRASFLNANGEAAVSVGTIYAYDTGVTFGGVEAFDPDPLIVKYDSQFVVNAPAPDAAPPGDDSNPPNLPTTQAKLTWIDPRKIKPGDWAASAYGGGDIKNANTGATGSLTWEKAQKVTGFVVYLYISGDSQPPTEWWPGGSTGGHGTWYIVGVTTGSSFVVDLRAGDLVQFCVAMYDGSSTLELSAGLTWVEY